MSERPKIVEATRLAAHALCRYYSAGLCVCDGLGAGHCLALKLHLREAARIVAALETAGANFDGIGKNVGSPSVLDSVLQSLDEAQAARRMDLSASLAADPAKLEAGL